jgi:transposase
MCKRRAAVVQMIQETTIVTKKRVSPVRRKVTEIKVSQRRFPSAAHVARGLAKTGTKVSRRTVVRDLRSMNYRPWSTGRGPKLTEKDKAIRVKCARKILRMSKAKRERIMFSDEKYFDTQTKRFTKQWGVTPPSSGGNMVQKGPSVFVLGFISRTHRNLVFVDKVKGTKGMDHVKYRELLDAYKDVIEQHVFQQDNAPAHSWLKKRGYFAKMDLLEWPPYSPDLNVIETMWAILAAKVAEKGPLDEAALRKFVKKEWEKIPMSTVRGLCEEFDTRLRLCVASGGELVSNTALRQRMAELRRLGR